MRVVRLLAAAAVAFVASSSAFACKSSGLALSVDLRTDYAAGVEVATVRTTVEASGSNEQSDTAIATGDARLVEGARMADFADLPAGDVSVVVRLVNPAGLLLVERRTQLTLSEDYALVVIATRACEGIVCPEPGGDPEATTCDGGRCVKPGCSPKTPEACPPPECTKDGDCPSKSACVVGQCVSGSCFTVTDPSRCVAPQQCFGESGCLDPTVTPPPPPPPMCPPPTDSCTSGCKNLQDDPANCGACDHACPKNGSCVNRVCKCPAGTVDCGDVCADLDTNPSHCGSCPNACVGDNKCCGGQCYNVNANEDHCGGCAIRCGTNEKCCDGVCFNTNISENHCGTCLNSCGSGRKCCSGVCKAGC